jgi:hypothetical protein
MLVIAITVECDGTHRDRFCGEMLDLSRRKTGHPGETFLMVAIRNLYWTESIAAFIVGGLILVGMVCSCRRRGAGGCARRGFQNPRESTMAEAMLCEESDRRNR